MGASSLGASIAAVLAVASLSVCDAATAVAADICAETAMTARGEPSSLEWLAKTKARANWRSRVRATPKLGTAYSTWSRAAQPVERCEMSSKGLVCTSTAIPCRSN
jgi:hypothetical protein